MADSADVAAHRCLVEGKNEVTSCVSATIATANGRSCSKVIGLPLLPS
jgi:hypothetical protein